MIGDGGGERCTEAAESEREAHHHARSHAGAARHRALRPDDGTRLRGDEERAGEEERGERDGSRARVREEVRRRHDAADERYEDDALVAEAVAERAARDATERAARKEEREQRAGDQLRVASADEHERQERRDGNVRPAAEPHREVQAHDGGVREDFA